jgi:hypothetical protein
MSRAFMLQLLYPDNLNKFRRYSALRRVVLKIFLTDVRELDDKAIFESVCLLKILSKQDPFCRKDIRIVDTRHSVLSFEISLDLTGEKMYDFLSYFVDCRLNLLSLKNFSLTKECVFKIRDYLFVVENPKFWIKLPEEFQDFRWPILVELFFDKPDFNVPYVINSVKLPMFDKRAFKRIDEEI